MLQSKLPLWLVQQPAAWVLIGRKAFLLAPHWYTALLCHQKTSFFLDNLMGLANLVSPRFPQGSVTFHEPANHFWQGSVLCVTCFILLLAQLRSKLASHTMYQYRLPPCGPHLILCLRNAITKKMSVFYNSYKRGWGIKPHYKKVWATSDLLCGQPDHRPKTTKNHWQPPKNDRKLPELV